MSLSRSRSVLLFLSGCTSLSLCLSVCLSLACACICVCIFMSGCVCAYIYLTDLVPVYLFHEGFFGFQAIVVYIVWLLVEERKRDGETYNTQTSMWKFFGTEWFVCAWKVKVILFLCACQVQEWWCADPELQIHAEVHGQRVRAQDQPNQDGRQGRVLCSCRELFRQKGRKSQPQSWTWVHRWKRRVLK